MPLLPHALNATNKNYFHFQINIKIDIIYNNLNFRLYPIPGESNGNLSVKAYQV